VLEKTKLDEHKQNVDAMKNFLKGNTARVLSDLEEKMRTHAKKLEFEEAAKIKLQVESIRDISVRQIARDAIE
jgi:excinuclease ABC subunit C